MRQLIITFFIDDDPDDHEVFEYVCKDIENVECIFANDGIQAIEKLKDPDFTPGLIFIDLNMPRMNGIECLVEIKKIERLNEVPVYMYSTSADPSIGEKCIHLGASGLIKKHANTDQIRNEFEKIIAKL
jgi:CheY-like chemotaxis protein